MCGYKKQSAGNFVSSGGAVAHQHSCGFGCAAAAALLLLRTESCCRAQHTITSSSRFFFLGFFCTYYILYTQHRLYRGKSHKRIRCVKWITAPGWEARREFYSLSLSLSLERKKKVLYGLNTDSLYARTKCPRLIIPWMLYKNARFIINDSFKNLSSLFKCTASTRDL